MRTAFVETLMELAADDDRIVLMTGDLGFMALEPFRDAFPSRFINVGVAEQNLIGLATGLADAGFTPFCYSIATFASMRGFEFFRNGAVWHDLPVRLVGMGGGFEYGFAGVTHHGVEDLGAMRLLPPVSVIAPADAAQTPELVRYAQSRRGPVYLRLGKNDRRRVRGLDGAFEPDRVAITRNGTSGLVLATGAIAAEAAESVEMASRSGLECSFGVVASLAPPPVDHLRELLAAHRWVATVEAHVRTGGLGSLVAEVLAEQGAAVPLLRCGVDDPFASEVLGDEAFMNELHGLSAAALERQLADFAESVS